MARDLTAGFISEINSETLRPCVFGKFYYDSGTLFLWTGVTSKTWNGDTYSGLGNLVSIGRVEESQVLKASGIQLGLNGISSANVALALTEPYQGRKVELFYGVMDASWNIVADPYMFFAGNMDIMEINDDPAAGISRIIMTVENEMVSLFRANNRNYTSEDQKAHYSGDLGLDFMTSLQDSEIVWKTK